MGETFYETPRLVARRWRAGDRAPFAALNGDPEVMRYFPAPLSPAESDAMIDAIEARMVGDGFGFPAIERKADGVFVGMVGLAPVRFKAPFTPAVEIGWRIARPLWRQGYAREAALGALAYGFGPLGLDEIVSFTAVQNAPSRAVMASIGMARAPADDFDHPNLPAGHPLRRHVLFRITKAAWAPA